jgi:hypothetical protein
VYIYTDGKCGYKDLCHWSIIIVGLLPLNIACCLKKLCDILMYSGCLRVKGDDTYAVWPVTKPRPSIKNQLYLMMYTD